MTDKENNYYTTANKKYRLACLVSHPVQYYSPLFKKIAEHPYIDLTVFYCSDESIRGMRDPGFGRVIKWDIPLLEGYRHKFLKNQSPQKTIFKLPFGLINLGIVKEISRKKYDAILIYSRQYITHLLAFLTARIKNVPILYLEETSLNQEILKPGWKLFIKKIILGLLFSQVTGFFAIGKENRKFYRYHKINDKKIFSVPFSVDNERLIKNYDLLIKNKKRLKKKIGIPDDKKVILFSGKLIRKKRPFDLLRAYERIKMNDKALVFMGDGELRKSLEKYVSEKNIKNVYFAGFKNQTEMPQYYTIADIFVLPSSAGETWGLVVNEAMCFHLPVIISDLPGSGKDLVRDGENGFIFRTGDIDSLSECLSKLIQNEDLRKSMGERSFEIIRKWDYEADIEGILSAFRSINSGAK